MSLPIPDVNSITSLLEHLGEGVAVIDRSGHISYYNPVFSQILSLQAMQDIDDLFSQVNHVDFNVLKRSIENWQPCDVLIDHELEGESLVLLCKFIPIHSLSAVCGFLYVTDLTAVHHFARQLDVMDARHEGLNSLVREHFIFSMTDINGTIVEVNQKFCDLCGYSQEELLGQNHRIVRSGAHDAAFWQEVWATILSGRKWRGDICNRAKDGREYWVNTSIIPVPDERGVFTHFISIRFDITQVKLGEAALLNAKKMAEQASVAKSQFLANMSHEIRTPMNAVLGMLQLLQKSSLQQEQHAYLDRASGAARDLLTIIDDILDFSKIEANELSIYLETFDLQKLLRDISVIVAPQVGNKEIEFVFEIDPAMPASLIGDEVHLRRVLINLCSNAIKFTEQGCVALKIEVVSWIDTSVLARFTVEDTGIGISETQLNRLFKPFSQAEASTTRRFGGTGLGLVICQRLVHLMGGEISVISMPGKGSAFSFTLDFPVNHASEEHSEHHAVSTLTRPHKVCLLDPHPRSRASIADMLGQLGWQVIAYEACEQLLDLLSTDSKQPPVDLVIADDSLQTGTSMEMCWKVRRSWGRDQLPILLMQSGSDRMTHPYGAMDRGLIQGTIARPVCYMTLSEAIESLASPQVLTPEPSKPQNESVGRLDNVSILLVEDNVTNQLVAEGLLRGEGAHVTTAGHGAMALDILAAGQSQFDIVLMDLQMPVLDGLSATREIRASGMAALPIIAMTANAMSHDVEACLSAGMNDHVGKPFELDTLVRTILKHLDRSAHSPLSEITILNVIPHSGSDLIQLDRAISAMGCDLDFYIELVEPFIENARNTLTYCTSALGRGEQADALRHAHSLKGAARTMGAFKLADAAGRLEQALRDHPAAMPDGGLLESVTALLNDTIDALRRLF
ncbi:response regulator [Burkholderiaceae bacterium DAT-1]|nr:response regulator [Burkholderiaceae bacterium DAT-1]